MMSLNGGPLSEPDRLAASILILSSYQYPSIYPSHLLKYLRSPKCLSRYSDKPEEKISRSSLKSISNMSTYPRQTRAPNTDIFISLTPEDRDTLKSATTKLSTYTTIGSLLGLGLTTALAFRVRQNRVKFFEAFKASRKPTHVKFADGG